MSGLGERSLLDRLVAQPVVPLALRAAAAAMLAWSVVLPFGGVAAEYAYYAPLGAVVSVSTSVTRTIRASGQAFLSLLLGAAIGVGAHLLPVPDVVGLGIVVAVGTLLAAWGPLGAMASWVPVSALFILILGGEDPWPYAGAYVGLTTVGALVGVAVNAAVPPLLLASQRRVQDALRSALSEQLVDLARALEQESPPTREAWQSHRWHLEPRIQRVHELISRADEGSWTNWRVRRWQQLTERQHRHGRALVGLAHLVEDLTELVADHERADLEEVALGPTLRPAAAHALRATATALDTVGEDSVAGPTELRRAPRALDGFAAAIRSARRRTDRDQLAAGALLPGVRRVLGSVAPPQ